MAKGPDPQISGHQVYDYTNTQRVERIFLCEYLVKGKRGMPMIMNRIEDEFPGQDYYDQVIATYKGKPGDYEENFFSHMRATMTVWKQCQFTSDYTSDEWDEDVEVRREKYEKLGKGRRPRSKFSSRLPIIKSSDTSDVQCEPGSEKPKRGYGTQPLQMCRSRASAAQA